MPKFPNPPGAAGLVLLKPAIRTVPAGSRVARIYHSRGSHPLSWNEFRHFGPLNSRWDHHLLSLAGTPETQQRSIYYAATETSLLAWVHRWKSIPDRVGAHIAGHVIYMRRFQRRTVSFMRLR